MGKAKVRKAVAAATALQEVVGNSGGSKSFRRGRGALELRLTVIVAT